MKLLVYGSGTMFPMVLHGNFVDTYFGPQG
jgi:hypothetical protein